MSTGALDGLVRSTLDEPVYQVRVVLRDEVTGLMREVETGRDGRFDFEFLPPGRYSLLAERLGYRPKLVRDIQIRQGRRVSADVELAATAVAERVDTVEFAGAALAVAGPGLSVPVSRSELARLPDERRELSGIRRLSSLAGAHGSMQGLPPAITGFEVDGRRLPTTWGSSHPGSSFDAPHLPTSGFHYAEIVATNPDVEWSGFAGGSYSGFTDRGSRDLSVEGFGTWTGDALRSGVPTGSNGEASSVQGGAVVRGSIIRDTASYALGFEVRRLTRPGPYLLDSAATVAELLQGAAEPAENDALSLQSEAVSGFGRLNWSLGGSRHLDARASFAVIPSARGFTGTAPLSGPIGSFSGSDLSSQVRFASRLGSSGAQEFGISVDARRRDDEGADAAGLRAGMLAAGSHFHAARGDFGSTDQRAIRLSEVLHFGTGDHRIKVGATAEWAAYEITPGSLSEFRFSDVADLARDSGYVVQTAGQSVSVEFQLPRGALFVQDTWSPGDGLDLLLGLRVDGEQLPSGGAASNEAFRRLTGIDNAELRSAWVRVSPRLGFTWDPRNRHAWLVHGSAGLYSSATDPMVLGEALAYAGGVSVARGFAARTAWAQSPTLLELETARPILSIVAPEFAPPRTSRAHLAVSRRIAGNTTLELSGLYRRTDLLPRRDDLNLIQDPVVRDQFERPVFGTLVRRGGTLVAAEGSNRRFADFDQVSAINLDGASTYQGATLRLDHQGERRSWFGSYTLSRTEDNSIDLIAGRPVAELAPRSLSGTGWDDGRSDLDVPHRLALGLQLQVPGIPGLELATLYQFQSGLPFTPGFRGGVDANGDGSFSNDPAFVDPSIAGMDALLSEWECLGASTDAFAARNSCRSEAIQSLDARVGFEAATLGRYRTELYVDAFNLLASGITQPDRALYVLDEAGEVRVEQGGRRVVVPLVANPNFGNPLYELSAGRVLQLGLRVRY